MIYIVALGVGLKCPRKIHLNTQWGGGKCPPAALGSYGHGYSVDQPSSSCAYKKKQGHFFGL